MLSNDEIKRNYNLIKDPPDQRDHVIVFTETKLKKSRSHRVTETSNQNQKQKLLDISI